ncbi:hypothetical protein BJY04DRAFT_194285 [Aspergillus karnatakaensis]|uniref:uncharacterized protein n=1 Tax=Aspergillus karnatakaensis TaxID=1810916 RepID=UPI003CCC939E
MVDIRKRDVAAIALIVILVGPFTMLAWPIRRFHRKLNPPKPRSTVSPPEFPRRPLTPSRTLGDGNGNGNRNRNGNGLKVKHPHTHVHAQPQSILFRKLPPEIREIVYFYILSYQSPLLVKREGDRVYSERYDYKYVLALHPTKSDKERERILRRLKKVPKQTITAFLTTCRRIYAESINILCKSNILRFRQLSTLNILPKWIVSHRLSTIRDIYIDIPPDYDSSPSSSNSSGNPKIDFWKQTCSYIETFSGLRRLTVNIPNQFFSIDMSPYLEPLVPLAATGPEIVVLAGKGVRFRRGFGMKPSDVRSDEYKDDEEWLRGMPVRIVRGRSMPGPWPQHMGPQW